MLRLILNPLPSFTSLELHIPLPLHKGLLPFALLLSLRKSRVELASRLTTNRYSEGAILPPLVCVVEPKIPSSALA